jgi:hypothetical protein
MDVATDKSISICLCIQIFPQIILERWDFHQNLIFQTDSYGFRYAIPIYYPMMTNKKTRRPLSTKQQTKQYPLVYVFSRYFIKLSLSGELFTKKYFFGLIVMVLDKSFQFSIPLIPVKNNGTIKDVAIDKTISICLCIHIFP